VETWRRHGDRAILNLLLDRSLLRLLRLSIVNVVWLDGTRVRPDTTPGSHFDFSPMRCVSLPPTRPIGCSRHSSSERLAAVTW
jgi:hypothetical protein